MRAITVRQPWAWAIIHGGKDVENRTRNIAGSYRGPVAIHAGLALDDAALDDHNLRRAWHLAGMPQRPTTPGMFEPLLREYDGDEADWLPLGAIIGVVDLVDMHQCALNLGCWRPADVTGWAPVCAQKYDTCSEWGMAGNHHLVLANPRPLADPIPYRGALGLWTLPDDVLAGAR
jgi:hypothetical protein